MAQRDPRLLRAEIVARYARGERHVDIARALEISVPYSSKVCRAAGLARAQGVAPRRVPTEQQRAKLDAQERALAARTEMQRRVVALYESGTSHADIARELGIDKSTSAKIARAHGLAAKLGTRARRSRA